MAESDIFVSNDIAMDVNFGEVFVVDPGGVYKVIASKYSSTATYAVGAYVLHLEKLYRCITAVSEPEEFDAEKWVHVLLADEVQIANANIALKADADSVYDKSTVDDALALKANASDVYAKTDTYNKTEVNNALATKADTATTYTKTEVDTALENKANSADVYGKTETYSKAEIDTNIYTKSETYNKTEVDTLISNLPEPMIFKGTLGVGGTIESLPAASAENEGWTYKVITAGTYAGLVCKVGDCVTCFNSSGSTFEWVISGYADTDTDTWRAIKVNGVEKLGNAISSGSVDFVDTTNVKFEFDSNGNAIKATLNGIDTSSEVDAKVAGLIDDTSTANNKTWSGEKIDEEISDAVIGKYENVKSLNIPVDDSIINDNTSTVLTNVTGDYTNGFVFTSTSGSVEFEQASTNDSLYIVTFTMSNFAQSKIYVAFGNDEPADVYYGESNTQIVLKGNGGNLKITNKSYSTTITNIKCYPVVVDSENTINLILDTTTNTPAVNNGRWNVKIGDNDTLEHNINGTRCIAIGRAVLENFVSGSRNIGIGSFALERLLNGDYNIALGSDSLWNATKAKDCIAIGFNTMSGAGTEIEHNIALGQDAMQGITTGKSNIAIGYGSMNSPQSNSVSYAVCIGQQSGNYANTNSTYIGQRAGYALKGINNTCLGASAGAQLNTTGENNIFIGVQSGIDNTGATSSNPKTVGDSIAIGYQARTTKSNQVVLGNASATEFVFGGRAIDKNNIAEIDDNTTSSNKAWSSNKINTELEALLPVDEVSGVVANFETDVVLPLIDVKADINAVQDLHGQSSAYISGGQLWDEQWELGAWSSVNGSAVNYTDRIRCKNLIPAQASTAYCIRLGVTASCTVNAYDTNGDFIENLVTGTFGTSGRAFTTSANCAYIKFSVGTAYGTTYNNDISINYPSTDTAYHPYSNICPISGFSAVSVVHCGKNTFDLNYLTASGITIQNGEASGTAQVFSDRFGTNTEGIKQLKFKANTAYTLSLKACTDGNYTTAGQGVYFRINYTDGSYTTLSINNNQQSYGEFAKTTSSSRTIDKIYIVYSSGYSNIWHFKDIQIEENSEATSFEPYNGTAAIINLGQTVYGGEVDVTNGKLVVTHHGFTLTGAEEEGWSISNTGTENYYYVISLPTGSSSAVGGSNITNIFPRVNIGNNNTSQGCYNTASALRVRWGTEMTVANWKTWLGTNNLTVVYKLATPVEYDLTPQQISALLGVNNVWSDTNGDTTVDYKLGIQKYIDKKIAEVQALVL